MKDIAQILLHYLVAALFCEEPEGEAGSWNVNEISQKSKDEAERDIKLFVESAGDKLKSWPEEQIGHDFWLTRCGHGAGFIDRDYPHADELQKLCKYFEFHGEVYQENGTIYIDNQCQRPVMTKITGHELVNGDIIVGRKSGDFVIRDTDGEIYIYTPNEMLEIHGVQHSVNIYS